MQYKKLVIPEWSVSDRPREKYMANGFPSLSDAELIAILLRSGTREETAVDLAKRILNMCDNKLHSLANCSLKDLMSLHGIGETKAITVLAAFELAKRIRVEGVLERQKVSTPIDVLELMQTRNVNLTYEEFWVLYLNQASEVIKIVNVSKGGLSNTLVDVRLILGNAMKLSATSIILCHNHPSGDVRPSAEDDFLTKKIREAAKIMDIQVCDHVIIGRDAYYSYAANDDDW